MIKGIESLLIGSADAKKLADFYKDVVGLKLTTEAEVGEDGQLFGFEFDGVPGIYIMNHDKVVGENNNPERIIFNLEVDDIEEEAKKVEDNGAKLIQEIYHVEGYGLIATFADLDGNYFQLVQVKEA